MAFVLKKISKYLLRTQFFTQVSNVFSLILNHIVKFINSFFTKYLSKTIVDHNSNYNCIKLILNRNNMPRRKKRSIIGRRFKSGNDKNKKHTTSNRLVVTPSQACNHESPTMISIENVNESVSLSPKKKTLYKNLSSCRQN